MNTKQYRQWDRQALWHPYSRHSTMATEPFPVIERGVGTVLIDTDGRRYLDAISSWWACNLGHSHPSLLRTIQRQAAQLQHSILGNMSHPWASKLAVELVALLGAEPRRVFFAGDGASAVEAALKISLQYWYNLGQPQRRGFISLENAYHGDTLGAMSIGYLEDFHRPFQPLMLPIYRAQAPFCAACQWQQKPHNCSLECLNSMARILAEHAGEIAAVIVEPLCQAAAGMRIYQASYLSKLAELCHQHKVLLIDDEIAMGFGRTARMFAFEHAGIQPDILCLGKGLAGGYLPISATLVKENIYTTFQDQPKDHTFYHGHTFAGNPIAAATALETLRVYREEGILAQAQHNSHLLAQAMQSFNEVSMLKHPRCLGMIAAVDLTDQEGQPAPQRAQVVRASLLAKGILIRPLGNVVYLMPPLIMPESELIGLVDAMRQAIQELS